MRRPIQPNHLAGMRVGPLHPVITVASPAPILMLEGCFALGESSRAVWIVPVEAADTFLTGQHLDNPRAVLHCASLAAVLAVGSANLPAIRHGAESGQRLTHTVFRFWEGLHHCDTPRRIRRATSSRHWHSCQHISGVRSFTFCFAVNPNLSAHARRTGSAG